MGTRASGAEVIEKRIALLDPRANDANAILSGETLTTSDGLAPRFLILGRQELEENPGCNLSRARDEAVVGQLGNAGWVEVFEYAGARVFARADDPLARENRPNLKLPGIYSVDQCSAPLLCFAVRL